MKEKGISPLIAAVLLIAFTMAVASLFAQWAPQLIQGMQQDTSNQSAEIQKCSQISFDFIETGVNSTTVQQVSGSQPPGNVSVTWLYSSGHSPVQNVTTGFKDNNRKIADIAHGLPATGEKRVLDEIRVQPTDCEGAATSVYP